MRVTYKLTAVEFVAAQHLHFRSGPIGFVMAAFSFFVAPVFGILLAFIVPFWRDALTASTVSGLIPALILISMPMSLYLYWRYRFEASRVSNSPCVIDFEEVRIGSEMPGFSKGNIEWAAIKEYRESAKVLLIYVSRTAFIVIPRRACEGAEYAELISLLDRKLASKSS